MTEEKRKDPELRRDKQSKDLTPIFDLPESKVVTESEPANSDTLFSPIKQFGEKIQVGHSLVEANPPYSLYAEGKFDDSTAKIIMGIVTQENLNITPLDLKIQLDNGKLLVPRVSEYAAIFLAMKLRDLVDNIQIGPSSFIFESKTLKDEPESVIISNFEQKQQSASEVLNFELMADSADDIVTSNIDSITGFEVVQVLTMISASKSIRDSSEFESASESLKLELMKKAYKLGANALIGMSFSLKALPASDHQSLVIVNATAVKMKKK